MGNNKCWGKQIVSEKIVSIHWTIDLPMKIPVDVNKDEIEFFLNKDTSGGQLFIRELEEHLSQNGNLENIGIAKVVNDEILS